MKEPKKAGGGEMINEIAHELSYTLSNYQGEKPADQSLRSFTLVWRNWLSKVMSPPQRWGGSVG